MCIYDTFKVNHKTKMKQKFLQITRIKYKLKMGRFV